MAQACHKRPSFITFRIGVIIRIMTSGDVKAAAPDKIVRSQTRVGFGAHLVALIAAVLVGLPFAFAWFVLRLFAYIEAGGTFGGYGAGAQPGEKYVAWAAPAIWGSGILPLAIACLTYWLVLR